MNRALLTLPLCLPSLAADLSTRMPVKAPPLVARATEWLQLNMLLSSLEIAK